MALICLFVWMDTFLKEGNRHSRFCLTLGVGFQFDGNSAFQVNMEYGEQTNYFYILDWFNPNTS